MVDTRKFFDELPPNQPRNAPRSDDPQKFVSSVGHKAFKNSRNERILDGFNLDSNLDFNVERELTVLFGGLEKAREIFDQIYNAPLDPQTLDPVIPPEVDTPKIPLPDDGGDKSGFGSDASDSDAKESFTERIKNRSSQAYRDSIASGTNVTNTPDTSGLSLIPDFGDTPESRAHFNINPPDEPSTEDDSTGTAATALLDPMYGSIVRGWNEKLNANNVKLSSLTPFAELYVVFPNDDLIFNDGLNNFSGIVNRISRVKFVSALGQGVTPNLPPGVDQNVWVARIGSTASQTQPDYYDEYSGFGRGKSGSDVRSYQGQPGLTDIAVSRATSGSYNIKYDVSLVLPNPEILNDQYEYSKLLLLNSTFLLIHGWNVKDSDFSVQSYPPTISRSQFKPSQLKLDPSDPSFIDDDLNSHELVLNGGNNGFWSSSLISLFNYSFEFDNVGHLVGKLRFLTTQGAFLSAISTDQVANPALSRLKEAPLKLLNRVPGTKLEEKQTFIFSNGIPWSKSDINESVEQTKQDTAEAGLREAYRQLNDNDLLSGGDLVAAFFDGQDKYDFTRYMRIRRKVESGVQRAANAVRDIFNNYGDNRGFGGLGNPRPVTVAKSVIPSSKNLDDYEVEELDPRFMTIRNFDEELGDFTNNWKILRNPQTSKRVNLNSNVVAILARSEVLANGQIIDRPIGNEGKKLAAIFPKGDNDTGNSFGNGDVKELSRGAYSERWDAFLTSGDNNNDLRNYYYNTILLNVANNDPDSELAFVPPDGYIVTEQNGVKRIVEKSNNFNGAVGELELFGLLTIMPKGQLIDKELKEATETFTEQPKPGSMPDFGKNLQQSIFTKFSNPNNLNHKNFISNSILDKEIEETITQTSTLSIPTLVSAPENPLPPNVPSDSTEAAEVALFIINFVNRVSETQREEGLGPTQISTIEVPNGYTVSDDNIYSFLQPGAENTTGLEKRLEFKINDFNIGTGAQQFFVSGRTFVLSTGYSLKSDRTNPEQDFVDGTPKPLQTDRGIFIPEINNLLEESNVSTTLKNIVESIIDFTGESTRLSQILQQGEMGNTGNIDTEIDGRKYNVIMRPTYYFLGSVLEAISEQLNDNVKFYYKPVPSKASDLTIPIPENRLGSELQNIESQIFDLNKQIVLLGGYPQPEETENRQKYLEGEGQSERREESAAENTLTNIIEWSNNFSIYMNSTLQSLISDGTLLPTVGDDVDTGGIFNTVRGTNSFDNVIRTSFTKKENRDAAAALNSSDGNATLFFKISTAVFGGGPNDQFVVFPTGIYTINASLDSSLITGATTTFDFDVDRVDEITGRRGQLEGRNFIRNFINGSTSQARANQGKLFPTINSLLRVPASVAERDRTKVDKLKESVNSLIQQKNNLGFDSAFNSLNIKTTFEIPVNIGAIEQILSSEGSAPSHSMLKKILEAAGETLPQLTLTMTPHNIDPTYIEVSVFSTNIDGVVTEVMTELDASLLTGESVGGGNSVEQLRRSVERVGGQNSYLQSEKIMVCNFGTINSLVENFQMSSKVDSNAFNTFRVPSMMGGVSLDIGNVLGGGRLETSGILGDIRDILNRKNGKIGGSEELKELRIVNADGKVDDIGLNVLNQIFTNQDNPVIRKSAEGFIQDLMSQDVKFYSKILALQSEYFDGLSPQQKTSNNLQEGERFAGSRFYGNILNNFLRTVTLTIHGTTNLTTFNYIYLKGLLQGVEGIYQIKSVNESITPTSFTTTIECGLVEYTQNDPEKNPLAYRGIGTLRRLAQINKDIRLDTGSDDATIGVPDFAEIVFEAEKEDNYKR